MSDKDGSDAVGVDFFTGIDESWDSFPSWTTDVNTHPDI